jgi:endoglucanase
VATQKRYTGPQWGVLGMLGVFIGLVGCAGPTPRTPPRQPEAGPSPTGQPGPAGDARHNLIENSRFSAGVSVPWTSSFTVPASGAVAVADDALCLDIEQPGANPWDAQLRHRELVLERGHTYSVGFTAWATRPTRGHVKIGMAGPPYTEHWGRDIELSPTRQTFSARFTMAGRDDPTAELALHLGGALAGAAPVRVCIDDIHIVNPRFTRRPRPAVQPPRVVTVNQHGYAPGLAKVAIYRTLATEPRTWQLVDAAGAVLARGRTAVHGQDAASGDHVHRIDFSHVRRPGLGYVLQVVEVGQRIERSHPFAIAADLYGALKYDAFRYFYLNRSAVALRLPYTKRADLQRPAGHLDDRQVACAADSGCNYKLNVAGGWYDAGDYGKYVVNGGISAWTLLYAYEHATGWASGLGDGPADIPESANGVDDLLDEARVELEFLLAMQAPEDAPLAGLVHHKVHDRAWTGLGLAPHESDGPRALFGPSTAATLNLAAVAAQAARVYRWVDEPFAARCRAAAERAYRAALAHPERYAAADSVGGGAYADDQLSDEWFWAAAELYVTTGEGVYLRTLVESPHWPGVRSAEQAAPAPPLAAITWQQTAFAGLLSLAFHPQQAGAAQADIARAAVLAHADAYQAEARSQGYGVPFALDPDGKVPWGSNGSVLNNVLALSAAHQLTGDARYLDALVAGMDYLLGRNPLDQSYVTGYGARPARNPHHRFWARQANGSYPAAPAGVVVGGPNSGLEDPYAQGIGLAGCAPLRCYVDYIESWSTNEVAINWNAPLVWAAMYLDHQARTRESAEDKK